MRTVGARHRVVVAVCPHHVDALTSSHIPPILSVLQQRGRLRGGPGELRRRWWGRLATPDPPHSDSQSRRRMRMVWAYLETLEPKEREEAIEDCRQDFADLGLPF